MEDILITEPAVHKIRRQRYSPEFEKLLKNSISNDEFWSLAQDHIKELYAKQRREQTNSKI